MINTQTQIDSLIDLAVIQRTELKQLIESLPQLRDHLSSEIERNLEEIEPAIRSELEQFVAARALDTQAKTSAELSAKLDAMARNLESTTAAKYSVLMAERAENANLLAKAEARIEDAASMLSGAVKEIVTDELSRFPRAGEIDQLRKEFAEPRGLNPRGRWMVGETYNKLDLVSVNGDSYVSNTDGNREKPSRSSEGWTLSAARGTNGGGGGVTSLTDLVAIPSNGQLLIGNGSAFVNNTITAGTGIAVTNAAGAITVSATGGVAFQGSWNASTNTPTLASSVGTTGHFYIVSVAGSTNLDGITDWEIGDWAIFGTSTWTKVDNTDKVGSVFGRTGTVVGVSTDYSAVGITNTAVGASSPSTGAFTTLSATTPLAATSGGTGVANNAAMTVTGSGNFAFTRTLTGTTNVTLPTTGTLATLAGTETLTNKTLTSPSITGGALNGTLGATTPSTVAATTITSSALTAGRVTFAGASGLLADDADFTFATDTLTATKGTFGGITHVSGAITSPASTNLTLTSGLVGTNKVNFPDTLTASSSTAGAVTIGNGTAATNVAIGGGKVNIGDTTAGSSGAGALVVQGGISAGQSAQASYFGGNVSISGPATATLVINSADGAGNGSAIAFVSDGSYKWIAKAASHTDGNLFTIGTATGVFTSTPVLSLNYSTAAATFAGLVNANATARITGTNLSDTTSTLVLDHASPTSRFISYGSNTTQRGEFNFLGISSNGSLNTNYLSLTTAGATFAGAVTIGNTVNSVSPTSPNRTVTMVVNGVTLYLAAKTTND